MFRVDAHAFSFDKLCVSKFLLNANVFTGATWDRRNKRPERHVLFQSRFHKRQFLFQFPLTINYFLQGQSDARPNEACKCTWANLPIWMRWQLRQFPGPSLLSPRLIFGVSWSLNIVYILSLSSLCGLCISSNCILCFIEFSLYLHWSFIQLLIKIIPTGQFYRKLMASRVHSLSY